MMFQLKSQVERERKERRERREREERRRERETDLPSLVSLFQADLTILHGARPCGEGDPLYSADSDTNPFQKHPQTHPD